MLQALAAIVALQSLGLPKWICKAATPGLVGNMLQACVVGGMGGIMMSFDAPEGQ